MNTGRKICRVSPRTEKFLYYIYNNSICSLMVTDYNDGHYICAMKRKLILNGKTKI